MALIHLKNIHLAFGVAPILDGVDFSIEAGERVCLIGRNGEGKSTLFKLINGSMQPDSGEVIINSSVRVAMLEQDVPETSGRILDIVMGGSRQTADLLMAYNQQTDLCAEGDMDACERMATLQHDIDAVHGWDLEREATRLITTMGLNADDDLSSLSGGRKRRVLLARALVTKPDVLLLDEPTNHLDILSIRWLEKFLTDFAGPVVVISHDHRFLDNVSTRILDVDYQTVLGYRGNYSQFLEAKSTERTRREKQIETRAREIAQHQTFVDRFRAKASKARQAQSKLRLIEKKAGELEELPGSSRKYPTFRFEPRRSSGREVLKVKNVRKAFGDNSVLRGINLLIERGDRLAIMGPNGIGKSTLLQIAMGDLEADEGEIIWGYETQVGYFAQDHRTQLGEERQTAENWLWTFCPGRDRGFVRGQMGLMLFSGDDGKKRLSALSGGEVARLIFSRLSLEEPNVLVLDEPTNHLDMESIEALVEELKTFQGTLILVSHDRWFVSQLATRVVEITSEYVKDYPGTYEEYVHQSGDDHLDVGTVVLKARREKRKRKEKPAPKSRPRVTTDEVEDIKQLEQQREKLTRAIEVGESRIAEIDELFCEPEYFKRTSDSEVSSLEKERVRLHADIQGLLEEWEDVEKKLGELVG